MSVIKDEYMLDSITRHDLLPLSFLKKSAYTGSRELLRYRIEKKEEGEGENLRKMLLVSTWVTPFAFDKTPKDEITEKLFDFREAALDDIAAYLNQCLEENR